MNKSELRQTILACLQQKRVVAQRSAQRAMESATDDETVPEHKYDTLALEASYLAHGQAMRVQECEQEIEQFKQLSLVEASEYIRLGCAVLLLDLDDNPLWFFIAPCCGGLKIPFADSFVMLVTFDSPLGAALKGKQVGDEVSYRIGERNHCYQIETIC
ncbi:transcription elongation factor [Vibrio sp. JPW-9-11-11]|uniref:GreA/GreB family elongation factor n=1 Tax=Vibrio sp. JPW-9-11-11 TaxID=1416532 RepID=UPI0015948B75|nr:GreA/GreB family elongation factor [Vibrio sp. JPW-9-11-11]NVD07348.1 transcription elongation factor [Vibrio sp. JPW-9-11-11]